MIFTYKLWEKFCKTLNERGLNSVTAKYVLDNNLNEKYVVLKHDVETKVKNALKLAQIEANYGHYGSYYVQAYLLENKENLDMLNKIKELGHEVSYHYDVMDFAKGDLDLAIKEFEKNKTVFEENNFYLSTLCQHGNPVMERVGYTSNRDFFRSQRVKSLYPNMCDIMVNFKEKADTEYTYFSDAGHRFNLIFDPINNDVIKSDDKNLPIDDMDEIIGYIEKENCIVSMHPHRWEKNAISYCFKGWIFKIIKAVAKLLMKVPFIKRIMSKYYYLAKKI